MQCNFGKVSRVVRTLPRTWSFGEIDEHRQICTARFKRHKHTYLRRSLEVETARTAQTDFSQLGHLMASVSEPQQARKVLLLLLHFSLQLGPGKDLSDQDFPQHPTIEIGSVSLPWRIFFCLICCSLHHPAHFRGYTHCVVETVPVCVRFKWR